MALTQNPDIQSRDVFLYSTVHPSPCIHPLVAIKTLLSVTISRQNQHPQGHCRQKWQQRKDLDGKIFYCPSPICTLMAETWRPAGLQPNPAWGSLPQKRQQERTLCNPSCSRGNIVRTSKEMSATIGGGSICSSWPLSLPWKNN